MNSRVRLSFLSLMLLILFFPGISPVLAENDPEAISILATMDAAKHPEGLDSFWCNALTLTAIEGKQVTDSILTPPGVPLGPLEIHINYVAPSDFYYMFGGFADEYFFPEKGLRNRGDDPMLLANPGLRDILTYAYDIDFIEDRSYDGDECAVLHLEPAKPSKEMAPFDLYIRTSDNLPVHTSIVIQAEGGVVTFDTQIEYTAVGDFTMPSAITTTAKPSGGSVFTTTTVFSDYQINPVSKKPVPTNLLGDDEPAELDEEAFDDIYEGFNDPPIEVQLSSSENALYTSMNIAFALEISSKEVGKELDKKHDEVVGAVIETLKGRRWGDMQDLRYEVGRELMDVINSLLTEGGVTDFYFIIYQPRR